ncbi:hypothetical protein GCM10010413_09590 [Promicromonospora sukumoe]
MLHLSQLRPVGTTRERAACEYEAEREDQPSSNAGRHCPTHQDAPLIGDRAIDLKHARLR